MNNFGFTKETEVLTDQGWISINKIEEGQKCLSYSIKDNKIVHDTAIEVATNKNTEVLKTFHGYCEFNYGKDHLWYGWKRMWAKKGFPRQKFFHKFSIPETTQEFNIICAAEYFNPESKVTPDEAAFLGWLLSDGYYRWSEDTQRTSSSFGRKRGVIGMIAQAQHKFYKEVEEVINNVNLPYTMHEDVTGIKTSTVNKYYFMCKEFRDFIDRVVGERLPKGEINWCKHLLSYDQDTILSYLYNFWLADGNTKGQKFKESQLTITQNKGTVSDSVLLAMFLQGRRVSTSDKESLNNCQMLRMLKNGHITLQEVNTESIGKYETYDILTSNGTYIIKQGSHMSITCSSSF